MAVASDIAPITDRLEALENRDTLRLAMCGSVDDGKSTLIGRLLFDTKTILADTLGLPVHLRNPRKEFRRKRLF